MEKEDTKIYLKDSASKEYVIYQTEKVDIQEELNKTITELQSQLKKQKEVNQKAIEYVKDNISIGCSYDVTISGEQVLYEEDIKELLSILGNKEAE